jgi:hypothetical protein
MAGADVIEAAIGITLLLIVSYVVLGSITTAADTVSTARKDMTLLQEERLGTSIWMADAHYHGTFDVSPNRIDFRVRNNGTQIIHNISQTEIMLMLSPNAPVLYKNGPLTGLGITTWFNNGLWLDTTGSQGEIINPGQWDPGEYLWGQVWVDPQSNQLEVILSNGVKASTVNIL